MPLNIGLIKESITNLDQANKILADAQAEGKRAVVVSTSNGRTLRIVKAQNWIQKFTGAVSGQNQREKGRLDQFLRDLNKQSPNDQASSPAQPSIQERSIKKVDTPIAHAAVVQKSVTPTFLAKSTRDIYDELRASHADSPIRDFLLRHHISRLSEEGSLICDLYDRLLASEMLLLESNAPKPTKDAWGLEMGGIRLSDPQFAYILARIEEAIEKNDAAAIQSLQDNPSEASSLEASSIKESLSVALKGKDYDLWETVALIKQLRRDAQTVATPSVAQPNTQPAQSPQKAEAPAAVPQVQASVVAQVQTAAAPPVQASAVPQAQPSVKLIEISDLLGMTKEEFNTWLANQIKNQQLESLWSLAPGLVAKNNYIRANQIKFSVKLALAEKALSLNKVSLGWTDAAVRQRARIVATKTPDLTHPNGAERDVCTFSEIDRRVQVQITAIEAGLIGDRILEN